MVTAKTPTIAKIKLGSSLDDARALLSIAVCEVCDFFNVGKNMNDVQVGITVDMIIEQFWHLRLEEIKYCFRRAMMREKLFDRLDGSIILGWLARYSDERAEIAARIAHEEELPKTSASNSSPEEITLTEYKELLRQRASGGDDGAAKLLAEIESATIFPTKEYDKRENMRDKIAADKFFKSISQQS